MKDFRALHIASFSIWAAGLLVLHILVDANYVLGLAARFFPGVVEISRNITELLFYRAYIF